MPTMNPMVSMIKWLFLGKPSALILFAFLMQWATAQNIRLPTARTSKNRFNVTVQLHHHNDTAPSQRIHLNQSFVQEIQRVKNMIDDLAEQLLPTNNLHHRQKRSGPQSPSSNNKLTMLETKMSDLNKKLTSLLHDSSLDAESRKRISELETSVHGFQTSFDNQRREIMQGIDKNVNEKIEKLTQTVNSINIRLNRLEENVQEEAKRRLPAEIVNDVKSYRFSTAEEKLLRMDDNTYYYVVHEVYNHQAANFDLVLSFGDSIRDMERKYKIYDGLYKEIAAGGFNDPKKLLRLSQAVRIKIINQTIGALAAQKLYKTLMSAIQEAAVEPISASFQNDNSWTTVEQLSADIYEECSECTTNIYNSVIDAIWYKISIDDLLKRSALHLKYLTEVMSVHLAAINKLERTGALRTNSVITLARYMKIVLAEPNYKNVDSDKRSQYEVAKNKIPLSVKNLIFSSAVCIKNTQYNEYLYAGAAPDYVYDDSRRNVFTWIPGDIDEPPKFKWYVTFYDSDQIWLRNDLFNEYLYAAGNTYDDTRRYAFTWRPGNPVSNGIWLVEVDGDDVYMFNTEHKEYLFADYDEKKHDDRRYVFTYRRGGKTSDSKWRIVDCSNS